MLLHFILCVDNLSSWQTDKCLPSLSLSLSSLCVDVFSGFSQKASNRSEDCVFIEMVLENNYTALMSARYKDWYVGFTKRGRPRRGPQTLLNQQDVHFMKRLPPGEQPDHTPFRFTTVSKRSKRVRAARPR